MYYALFDENNDNEHIEGTGLYYTYRDAQDAAQTINRANDTMHAVPDIYDYDNDEKVVHIDSDKIVRFESGL